MGERFFDRVVGLGAGLLGIVLLGAAISHLREPVVQPVVATIPAAAPVVRERVTRIAVARAAVARVTVARFAVVRAPSLRPKRAPVVAEHVPVLPKRPVVHTLVPPRIAAPRIVALAPRASGTLARPAWAVFHVPHHHAAKPRHRLAAPPQPPVGYDPAPAMAGVPQAAPVAVEDPPLTGPAPTFAPKRSGR